MKLTVERKYKKDTYTIGKLYIDGKYFCDTIEDKDRGLDDSMTVEEVKKIKKYGETAIPTGTYEIDMNTVSPKYSKNAFYKKTCDCKIPRLKNVKGFEGVLIHCGNTAEDSYGCILVGYNTVVGKVMNSRDTFTKFMDLIRDADNLTLTIK